MVDLLRALHFRRVVGEVLVYGEGEVEDAAFVHALVWLDRESEIKDVIGVRKGRAHGGAEGEVGDVCCRRRLAYGYTVIRGVEKAWQYLFVPVAGLL